MPRVSVWPMVSAGFLLYFAALCNATPVTYSFTGYVTSDAINGCGGLVRCGKVAGSYTVTAPSLVNSDPFTQHYAVTNFTFSIEGSLFFSSPGGLSPGPGFASIDHYGLLATGVTKSGRAATLSILLTDATAKPSNSSAPLSNLSAATSPLPVPFQLSAADRSFQLTGVVTTLSSTPPSTGFIRVCNIAGPGVALQTNLAFTVAGTPVTVAAGLGPMGNCSVPLRETPGLVNITELAPAGAGLKKIDVQPPEALWSSNTGTGTASVMVVANEETVVTFTNTDPANTGFIQVCNVAGPGIPVGTKVPFAVAGQEVMIAAGPGPLGTCSTTLVEPVGVIGITQTIPTGTAMISITTQPQNSLFGDDLSAGKATVIVSSGNLTVVTFTDTALGNNGLVRVCRVGGAGILLATPSTFTVGGALITVPSGAPPLGYCSPALIEPQGPLPIRETLPSGVFMTSVRTEPAGKVLKTDLSAAMATVAVTAGAQTTVTFTDDRTGFAVPSDAFQVRYAANLDAGDSVINITNTGARSTSSYPTRDGNLCVNAYAFAPDEQLISCCSCSVTPSGLVSLSVKTDLTGNPLTPVHPPTVVVKLLATSGGDCNPATAGAAPSVLAAGLAAWGTTLHDLAQVARPETYVMTETPFTVATLSAAELARITSLCGFIQVNGGGYGICGSCRPGGLGAIGR